MAREADGETEGEPGFLTNLFFPLSQQVQGGGNFAQLLHEDTRLKHCWGEVR